ncbi:hypothetical protein HHK36_024643 [Tetracentron sinense]|uniref:Adenylate isopentenyltransferase n=1 Tax=Tetracentron sinense TaxID=13715 RepID=A0A835D4U6_TETSI|nr:hypothetical protein HHK36_024643 [Tetracentron sinense]
MHQQNTMENNEMPQLKALSLGSYCNKVQSLRLFPAIKTSVRRPRWPRMDSTTRRTDKIIVIMGATGTGKSRLSVELATRFSGEIINSDKMQVYKGLDITTNKIPMHERLNVPHHLLGEFDSSDGELSPLEYRLIAGHTVETISSRRRVPIIAGGSNSFIHALLADRFDPESDVFDGFHSISGELRYKCCFLWVDLSPAVLSEYLSRRVDDMIQSGMIDELAEFFDPDADSDSVTHRTGIRKAIGVPEFDHYFRSYPPGPGGMIDAHLEGDLTRRLLFEEAVKAIKDNTCQLVKRQIGKILRLKSAGWDLQRLDATEAFRAVLASNSGRSSEIWEKEMVEPSVEVVKRFLEE